MDPVEQNDHDHVVADQPLEFSTTDGSMPSWVQFRATRDFCVSCERAAYDDAFAAAHSCFQSYLEEMGYVARYTLH